MKMGDKAFNFISLYRSPNHSFEEFETFVGNLELNLDTVASCKKTMLFSCSS